MKALLHLLTALALLLATPALAQDAATQTGHPPAATKQTAVQGDVQALDRVISLINDPQSREALVDSLAALRARIADGTLPPAEPTAEQPADAASADATEPATGAPAEAAATDETAEPILSGDGLLSALTESITNATRTLPDTALGGPLNEKFTNAAQQVHEKVQTGLSEGAILAFLAKAVPGWLLIAATALLFYYLPFLRRARAVHRRPESKRQVLALALKRLVLGLMPLIAAAAAFVVYLGSIELPVRQQQLAAGLAAPVLLSIATWQIGWALLALLGPSRGWHLVNYCQKRLLNWVAAMVVLGTYSKLFAEPPIRIIFGWDLTDILRLGLDLALAIVALVFVMRHRVTVRRLILKGRVTHDDTRATSIMDKTINAFGNVWHMLAATFIIINLVARLFGEGGSLLVDMSLAMLIVAAGLLIATWLDNFLARHTASISNKGGARHAILSRYVELLRIILQVVILLTVVFMCLDVWNLDLKGWLLTQQGWSIARPLLSIALALLVSWLIWITLDGWIEGALAPTDKKGRTRQQSSRTKTLLPLVRNFLFIALSIITVIAVLANIGVNVAPLLAGAGVIGLAVGFGSQQLVQDVITGMFILFEDTIAIGDWVDTGDRAGTVEQLTIRTLRLRDGEGALHSIPFSSVKAIKNSSRGYGVYVVEFKVGYQADLDKIIEIMREIGAEQASDPNFQRTILIPFTLWGVDQFAADGIVIKGAIRTKPLQQWSAGREFNRRLKDKLDAEGIFYAPTATTSFTQIADKDTAQTTPPGAPEGSTA